MNHNTRFLEIDCAGEQLHLLPEKAVFWPRMKTLIVADLHFGKAAAFRKSGIAVPESTTDADLERLTQALNQTASENLVILGDFFHAPSGLQIEMMGSVANWCRRNLKLKIILVPGNHDAKSGPPPLCWNIKSVDDYWSSPPFAYCHEPKELSDRYILAGHVHPAISLRERFGPGIRAPCFCFGSRRAVLPAFGSFTGMRSIEPEQGERIFAVGTDEVVEVTSGLNRFQKAPPR